MIELFLYNHGMIPAKLCRERLERIQRLLGKNGGTLPVRTLVRSCHVLPWEIEEAAALGWLEILIQKPRTGRPSRMVRVSKTEGAKLPPYRWQMGKRISHRHAYFAMLSTCSIPGGCSLLAARGMSVPCTTDVYQQAFPRAKKRKAAAASASRLRKRPEVRAARAWYYSRYEGVAPKDEPMPRTANAIWNRLRELGSWRVAA